MKRVLLFCAVLACCLVPALPVSAHFLQSDNGVHGMLHINPTDYPAADHKAQLIFYMTADHDTFSAHSCGCSVTVMLHDQPLETSALRAGNGVLTTAFMPPEAGPYKIILRGNTFTLVYSIRAEPASHGMRLITAGTPVLIVSTTSMIILGIIAYSNIKKGRRYVLPSKEKKT